MRGLFGASHSVLAFALMVILASTRAGAHEQRAEPSVRGQESEDSTDSTVGQEREGHSEDVRSGPLGIFQNLGSLANPFQPILKTLAPIPQMARAPFLPRARTRLEPEALNQVEVGDFARSEPNRSTGLEPLSPIRVVSWNIERGLQYERILKILREDLQADIYLLQEVDRDARRTEFRDVARSLAAELGMHFAFGIEFQELIQGKSGEPAVHGQATLSRFPISSARVLRFRAQPKDWSQDWFQPREGGRIALVTEIDAPGALVVVYNAHLESRGNDRGRSEQMREILEDFRTTRSGTSLLVGGDLNTAQGLESPVFEVARQQGLELLHFSERLNDREARRQKDWILAAGVRASEAILHHQIAASDHKPVSFWIRLGSD